MQQLTLELPEPFYDPEALREYCSSFVVWKESGPFAVLDSTDELAWEQLNKALRTSLGKAIQRESI